HLPQQAPSVEPPQETWLGPFSRSRQVFLNALPYSHNYLALSASLPLIARRPSLVSIPGKAEPTQLVQPPPPRFPTSSLFCLGPARQAWLGVDPDSHQGPTEDTGISAAGWIKPGQLALCTLAKFFLDK